MTVNTMSALPRESGHWTALLALYEPVAASDVPDLGVDDDASAEAFERAFEKIVPPRPAPKESRRDRG